MNGVTIGDRGVLPAAGRGEPAGRGDAVSGGAGTLRPHGYARTRTVRRLGAATLPVTPRRARCAECGATQILLPGALSPRRADATEVIGHALVAKAGGSVSGVIATQLGRPASTVRRWLRRVPEHHARWLYRRAVEHCARGSIGSCSCARRHSPRCSGTR